MHFSLSTKRRSSLLWVILLYFPAILFFYLGYTRNISRFELLRLDSLPKDNYILVFYQPSCPHCIKELPVLFELSQEYNIPIHSVNIIEEPYYIEKYSIRATPTMILFFNGQSLKLEGEISKDKILQYISDLNSRKKPIVEVDPFGMCSVNSESSCD